MAGGETPAVPQVLWAQRSSASNSKKNIIYVTVSLPGIIHPTSEFTITNTSISFEANAKDDDTECKYAFKLDFYAEVVPKLLEKRLTPGSITITLLKKHMSARYWPRLSTAVLAYVTTDFNRWTWEGDQADDIEGNNQTHIIGGGDINSKTGGVPLLEQPNKLLTGITSSTFPLVLWAQQGSATERRKNIIYLTINAQDIVQSTLKCTVTSTSISFHAIARKGYEECEYAFNLDFYADVEPEAFENHLTSQYLTVILLKKQMDARHWPRLQRAEKMLPFVETDFRRWRWEGDHNDDIIDAKMSGGPVGANGGQHFEQLRKLNKCGIFFFRRFERLGEMGDIDKSISIFKDVVQLTPDGHANKPGWLSNFGSALIMRFERLGEMGDIEQSISSLEDAVRLTPDGYADKPSLLNNLGHSLLSRFRRLGEMGDIEQSISRLEDGVRLTPDGRADEPSLLNNLRNSLLARFERLGKMGDIKQSISSLEDAVRLTPDGHADKPNFFGNLGSSLLTRFEHLGEMGDIEKAISRLEDAVRLTPDGHVNKPSRLTDLGSSLQRRFERLAKIEDIEKAISSLEDAVRLTPDGHAGKPRSLGNLGCSLLTRFEHLGEMGDIEQAISSLEGAVRLTPDSHVDKPSFFGNLGCSLLTRFGRLGEMGDIEKGISSLEDAVRLTPDSHVDKPSRLNNLGSSLQKRFKRLAEMEDIEKGISNLENAVRLTPDGHTEKPTRLSNLGNSLLTRFEHLGEMGDIEKAISSLEDAVRLTPDGHAHKPNFLNNLGNSLQTRFERLGEMGDIKQSISSLEDAVRLTPDGHAHKPTRLSNLGNSLLKRFERLGEMGDIEKAISSLEDAVRLTPDGHTDKPSQLSNLGNSLMTRFERLGEMGDMEKGISSLEDAVRLTPDGHTEKPSRLSNLGNSFRMRFQRLGEMGDIKKAISRLENAVRLTPDGHTEKPTRLSNLGVSLLTRFQRLGQMGDIEQSISSLEDAVRLVPDGHTDKPCILSNLGSSLLACFKRLGEIGDIEKAISSLENAVRLTPDGHAGKAGFLYNLGNSLMSRFQRRADSRDLKQSLLTVFESATQLTGQPSVRFRSAILWAERARLCRDNSVPSALEAYATAFELLPRLSWLGLSIASRQHELLKATTLARDAAATAISANNLHLALEWLEQGRSVLWGQILHLRTPVDDLCATHPKLAKELVSIAIELEQGNSQTFLGSDENKESPADAVQKHREHASHWERVVEKVRELPGFERFLLPKQYSELRHAACDGPVVVLNASQYGCDALIIASPLESLHHVHLPDLTYAHAESLRKILFATLNKQGLRDKRHVSRESEAESLYESDAFRNLLGQLWELVVKPVRACFESLKLKDNIHIRWCPTGPLVFLPIHAAGIYNEDGIASCSLEDFAISSYVPSLTALLNSSQRKVSERAGFELLIVAPPNIPGADPLPGAKEELKCIHKHVSDKGLLNRSLEGSKATVAEVLSAMEQCSWVHFACHGIQDISDPMKSGLLLRDSLLQLSGIIKKQLPNAEFAFLSACQTATGDESRPEEAIHIAAGMLLAGYRGVVGTMWSIRDNDAPFVANDLYMQLLKSGKPNSAKAAHALHATTRRLRERPGGCPFASWVPFIHMGV